MHHIRIVLGSALACAIIGISAVCNWRFGLSLASGFEAQIYALLGASADLFKALVPLMIAAAWAAGERLRAVAGIVVFGVLTTYSLTSAIGLYILSRDTTVADIEVVQVEHQRLKREISRTREALTSLGNTRLPAAVAADLAARKHDRIYTRSRDCSDATVMSSREFCAHLAELKGELAVAQEAVSLKERIRQLEASLSGSKLGKVLRNADPQAEALARLTGATPGGVRTGLALLIATLIELGSGLGLWLATAGTPLLSRAPRGVTENAVEEQASSCEIVVNDGEGSVEDWAEARIERRLNGQLSAKDLRDDYRAWCKSHGAEPITDNAFGRQLSGLGLQRRRTGGQTFYLGVGFDHISPKSQRIAL